MLFYLIIVDMFLVGESEESREYFNNNNSCRLYCKNEVFF